MSHGMDGLISEHPFAELIIEILEKRFSGALRVERKRVKAVVYFDSGDFIYATSNLKNLRLTEYLRKRGVPVEKMLGMDSFSDFAAAASLLARGMVTQSTLEDCCFGQMGSGVLKNVLVSLSQSEPISSCGNSCLMHHAAWI